MAGRKDDLAFHRVDVDSTELLAAILAELRDADFILHPACSVAVKTSECDSELDVEVKSFGTSNLTEAAQASLIRAPIVFWSASNPYGGTENVSVVIHKGRHDCVDGDGTQVRDELFVHDLADAFNAAAAYIDWATKNDYSISRGSTNEPELAELLEFIEVGLGATLQLALRDSRPPDQRVFLGAIRHAKEHLGQAPSVSKGHRLRPVYDLVAANQDLFK